MDGIDEARAKADGERAGNAVRMIFSGASTVNIERFNDNLPGGRMEAINVRADFPDGTIVSVPRVVIDRYPG